VVTRAVLPLVLGFLVAACASGGSGSSPATAPGISTPVTGSVAPIASAASAASDQPIANRGPSGWNRGPYDLAGGSYRLDWQSDGTCSALYFGLVGVSNHYRESPPTAGDVALADMLKGSRTIAAVPAGSYYFNVSNVACKSYSATLTRVP
jgi:hypothetical protein